MTRAKKKNSIHHTIIIGFISIVFLMVSSCVGGGGRKGRPSIEDFSRSGAGDGPGCLSQDSTTPLFLVDTSQCANACPEGTKQATQAEQDEFLASADQTTIDIVNDSSGICIEDVPEVNRPTRQIFVKNDYCSCLNGRPDILNACDSFCAGQTANVPTLFGSVTLGPDVALNESLGNLFNWCNAEIPGDDLVSPSCTLQAFDGSTTTTIALTVTPNSNSFTANLSALQFGKTYVLKIVESGSGSNAESIEFQVRRKEQDTTPPTAVGPLKIMPVSQYTCIERSFTFDENDPNDITIIDSRDRHFYFPANEEPVPIPPNNPQVKCHDVNLFGEDDNPLFPRLELIPQSLGTWDISDIRFADQNQNDIPDISDTIKERLLAEFNLDRTVDIFRPLIFPKRPDTGVSNDPSIISSASSGPIGVVMQPFIDPLSGLGFCPKQEHYNGIDPVFRVLKEVVGVDTEGLFFALEEAEVVDSGENTVSPSIDILLIRENLLKKIWFFEENGQRFVPNAVTAGQKTIHFFYPPDEVDPLVQKSTQKIFTIKRASELGGTASPTQSNGLPSAPTPPDKRFGCIPALD